MSIKNHVDTLAVAESITGGLVADAIVSNKGASNFFKGGVVTYSMLSKTKIFDISENLITITNGVSKDVCEIMAKSVSQLFNADYGIATTGYAEEGDEPGRISEKKYAYVSLYSVRHKLAYTTLVLGRSEDSRNDFRYHVTKMAEFLWQNRTEFFNQMYAFV